MRRRLLGPGFALQVLGVCAVAVGTARSQAPPGQPSFPTEAEIVTVDVVVSDDRGEPVTDLTAGDFTVKEEGVAQTVTGFELVHRPAPPVGAGPPAAPPPPPRVSSNRTGEARATRAFMIVFDDLHLDAAQAQRARVAARDFLDTGVSEGDLVGVVATGTDASWVGRMPAARAGLLQVLERLPGRRTIDSMRDYMSDYEAMRIFQDGDPAVTERVARRFLQTQAIVPQNAGSTDIAEQRGDPGSWVAYVRARAGEVYGRSSGQNQASLTVMTRAVESLTGLRGRKTLVLLSAGFVRDPRLEGFRELVAAARRANVAVYFIDARGLEAGSTTLATEMGVPIASEVLGSQLAEAAEAREGSESIADDTGGFTVKNANDLAGGLRRIARESQTYYLLGYPPTSPRRDGRFRRIEVKVKRPGVTVRARRGYYAPGGGATPAPRKDAAIQRALDSPLDLPDVPLRAGAHVFAETSLGRAQAVVTIEADVRGFAFREEGGLSLDTLDFLLVVAHRDTAEHYRYDHQFEMKLRPETRSRLERECFPVTRSFDLAPGVWQARVVVRDRNSGRTGSLTHEFEVPPLEGGLRLSTLVLSDRLGEGSEAGVAQPVAHRSFTGGATLHARFEIYGATPDDAGARRVSAGFAVRFEDGRMLAAAQATPVKPGPGGILARSAGIPLDAAPPGRYEFIVVVRDEVSGRTTEAREPFTVVGGP